MKRRALLLLLPLSLLLTSGKIKPELDPIDPSRPFDLPDISLSLNPLGPCEEYGTDVSLTGTLTSTNGYTGVRERLSVAPKGGTYSYFHTTASHDVVKGRPYSVSLPMPIHNMLSSSGIDCKVALLNSSSVEIQSYLFSLKPITKARINVNDYLNTPYKAMDTVIDPDNYGTSNYESVMFDGFIDYFNEDNYYRLNLNKLKFTYSCPKVFPGCNATLNFTDYNNVFPYLSEGDALNNIRIPLRTAVQGSKFYFDFPEQMYVNPQTLEMSIVAKPGYRLTKYFYLPINKKELLIDEVFTLEVRDFGYNKLSFSWTISYLNNRNLIGDCDNSDYCVVGEME